MWQFIKNHQDLTLVGCALVVIGLLIGAFGWGMYDMSTSVGDGLKVKQGTAEEVSIDIAGAEKIFSNRGLSR